MLKNNKTFKRVPYDGTQFWTLVNIEARIQMTSWLQSSKLEVGFHDFHQNL